MKKTFLFIVLIILKLSQSYAQNSMASSRADMMLMQGEYKKAIDTCKLLISTDSLNSELYFKMGIAYQNLLNEDSSVICFKRAVDLKPDNKSYCLSLAKGYYNEGKVKLAEPFFYNLCKADSTSWVYSYFLSDIYMQTNRVDEALQIYSRFIIKDSMNWVILDKAAFAYYRNRNYEPAIRLYEKSLSINKKDITAIKNLSFLYATTVSADSAISILSKGIEIDSTDMDLYIKRANIYFLKNYAQRALIDYLVVLASGDSSKLYLKRAGIGYCFNLQPKRAIFYLLKAYKEDSTDFEICNYLGQCYSKTKDFGKSVHYYRKSVDILLPIKGRLGMTYELCAGSQKDNKDYTGAIESYLKAYDINNDLNIMMIVANIYDEGLKNKEMAIYYYQKFLLGAQKSSWMKFPKEYLNNISERLDYLKKELAKPAPRKSDADKR